ncbi:YopX family protein [Paenibacillus sp. FSL L8-0708]|uniref:YopX family protein n=1 Tax=Paenibacillus sp. FSL L8-0708 TaxID=2975311 RepID=UPI0030FC682E
MGSGLKYKFWDKEEKVMIDPRHIGDRYSLNYYQGLWMSDTKRIDEDGYDYEMDVEFLRFADIEDKNGVEVHQSHILKIPDLYETPENTETTYHNEVVTYEEGTFKVGGQPLLDDDRDYLSREAEVVGNIYENPELLEKAEV